MVRRFGAELQTNYPTHVLSVLEHRQSRAVLLPPVGCSSRCNSFFKRVRSYGVESEASPSPSPFEWYWTSGVIPYINLDGSDLSPQEGQVVDVVEMSRNHLSVLTCYGNDPQQRHNAISDNARLHNTRVDVERFQTLVLIHHGVAFECLESVIPRRTTNDGTRKPERMSHILGHGQLSVR